MDLIKRRADTLRMTSVMLDSESLKKWSEDFKKEVVSAREEMKDMVKYAQELEKNNAHLQDELALALTRIEELEARNEYEVEK